MNFGGFIGLLIGLAIWAFVIFAVILAVKSEFDEEKNSKKKR